MWVEYKAPNRLVQKTVSPAWNVGTALPNVGGRSLKMRRKNIRYKRMALIWYKRMALAKKNTRRERVASSVPCKNSRFSGSSVDRTRDLLQVSRVTDCSAMSSKEQNIDV